MPRIRTIKPEFPQSESMGRISRDARLLFVELWTLADDSGRLRGASRMLASLLFPYDNDAPELIDGWLEELVKESCIIRYIVAGQSYDQHYIQITNWLSHQKIDKPSPSESPSFNESSRILANPREGSSEDQGPRIKEGIKDQGSHRGAKAPFVKPSLEEVSEYCRERNKGVDPESWIAHYDSNGWRVGRNSMKDWQAAVRTWEKSEYAKPAKESTEDMLRRIGKIK